MSSEDMATGVHKYKVGERFNFMGIVEIVERVIGGDGDPLYKVRMQDGLIKEVTESWIDIGITHFGESAYAVSYIASAPDTDKPWNVRMFRNITNQMCDIYERKNADYGDSFSKSVEKYGFISALTRISDKFNRIENLILGAENKVPDESLEDTLLDLGCYAIMTAIALRGSKIEPVDFKHVV